jgi:hypothetical protein
VIFFSTIVILRGHTVGNDRPDTDFAVLTESILFHDRTIEADKQPKVSLTDL